jgi:hypothetical protein
VHIGQVRALVRWDGRTEDIVMELGLDGNPSEAAWFLPVPARATLKLGDAKLFDALQDLTKPEVRVEQWPEGMAGAAGGAAPEGGAGAPPVTLLERRALGPFDVSTLAASDADALGAWLKANGYQLPDDLVAVIQPYIAQGWYYIAVRLRPGQGETLGGRLDPLWVAFPSDQIIYPMRVLRLALPHRAPHDPPSRLPLFLYVLADHRVEAPESVFELANPDAFGPMDEASYRALLVKFAGWVDPAMLAADSPLAPLVAHRRFLTKFQIEINDPARIANDFLFSFAAEDTPYREVEIRYDVVPAGGNAPSVTTNRGAWLLLGGIGMVGLLVLVYRLQRDKAT